MDIQMLINSLTAGGFRVQPHGKEGVSITPAVGLSNEQRSAIVEHKATLRLLACIPSSDDYERGEREAIQFADAGGIEADMALIRARFEWQELIETPAPCDVCGSLMFRWDLKGERHCISCDPGQSARLLRMKQIIQ